MRLDKRARDLVLSFMLAYGSSLLLSSCVGHEERLPSGKTARILRLYKDNGIVSPAALRLTRGHVDRQS